MYTFALASLWLLLPCAALAQSGGVGYADSPSFSLNTTGLPTTGGGVGYADSSVFTLNTTGLATTGGGVGYADSGNFTLNTTGIATTGGGVGYADSAVFTFNTLNVGRAEPAASYLRTYVNDIPNQPLVNVVVTNAFGVSCFSIEETLSSPVTALALSVSGDGVYLPGPNVIRWGPYTNIAATNVYYRLTGLPGIYPVNGGAWMDGQWYFSPGVTMIPVLPALSPGNLPIVPSQLPPPTFSPGSGNPASVTINESQTIPSTIYFTYTTDGTTPTPTSSSHLSGSTSISLSTGQLSIVRARAFDSASGYLPSIDTTAYYGPRVSPPGALVTRAANGGSASSPVVNFNLAAVTDSKTCVAITETLPPGLSAINVTSGGAYVAANNAVEWGPFLGPIATMTLSFQAVGPPGTYPVFATWSSNGVSANQSSGDTIVIAPPPAPTPPIPPSQLPSPTFTPSNGNPSTVTINESQSGPTIEIFYTINGTPPTESSLPYQPGVTTLNLTPSQATVLRARAFDTANVYLPSVDTTAYYGPQVSAPAPLVTRTANGGSASSPVINFNLTGVSDSKTSVAITETLPPGLSAINVTSGGAYVAANNAVEWGPFLGPMTAMTLSFQAVGLPGTYPVFATWSSNGVSANQSSGDTIVIAPPPTPTPPSPPSQLPSPTFSPGSGNPGSVTMNESQSAPTIEIFYTINGTPPTESSLPYQPGVTTLNLTPSQVTVLRARAFDTANVYLPSVDTTAYYGPPLANPYQVALTSLVTGEDTPEATVTLTPPPHLNGSGNCYAVVVTIPYGLSPLAVAPSDGQWDPLTGEIRWGPYLNSLPGNFSFGVTGVTGLYTLTSQVSVNGYSTTTTASLPLDTVGGDRTPPTLTISNPQSDDAVVTTPNLLVTGTATDSGTGNNGIAFVTVNGVPASDDTAVGAGTANWSSTVPLLYGENTIVVVAADSLDNTTEEDISVIYAQPTIGSISVSTGGGSGGGNNGSPSLQTTLTGVSSGETVSVQSSSDLVNWTLYQAPNFQNPIPVTGPSVPITIPVNASTSGLYFRIKLTIP